MRVTTSFFLVYLCLVSVLTGQAYFLDAGTFDPITIQKHPLSDQLDVAQGSQTPIISMDGNTLILSRKGHPLNFGPEDLEDLWISYQGPNQKWSPAVNAGAPLNDHYSNAIAGMDPSGSTFYFTQFDSEKQTIKLKFVKKQGRSWSAPTPMTIDSFHYYKNDYPSFFVSADGRFLLISMIQSRKSGKDIFVSFRKNSTTWTTPLNLGSSLNTRRSEGSVFLAADGRTLYFSSNGHKGFGGQDLFYTKRLDDSWLNWSTPINMGTQFNTSFDDTNLSIPVSGHIGYYLSEDSEKRPLLYSVQIPMSLRPNPVELIKGNIFIEGQQKGDIKLTQKYNPLVNTLQSSGSLDYIIPHRPGHVIELFDGIRDYYPELKRTLIPEDELDFDQYDLLASIHGEKVTYFQREAEINMLQVQINDINNATRLAKVKFQTAQNQLSRYIKQLEFNLVKPSEPQEGIFYDTVPPPINTKMLRDTLKIDRKNADPELIALKQKFKKYYPEKKQEETEQFLWGEALGYEDFQDQVTKELITELAPEVAQSLKFKLYGEVIQELEQELPQDALRQLENNESELREQIKQSLIIGNSGVHQAPVYAYSDLPDWQKDLKKEIKASIEDKVKQQLEAALKDEVKATLKSQLTFLTQKGIEEEMKQRLDDKVEQQIIEEQEMGLAKDGLIPYAFEFQPTQPEVYDFKMIQRDYNLIPIAEGKTIRLGNVAFAPNSAVLKKKAYEELDQLVSFLKNHPKIKIEIGSHTNGWVSHSFAQELSEKRAMIIKQYLKEKKVSAKRVYAVGYGKKKPLASNETVEGRRMNQRIEMTILQQ